MTLQTDSLRMRGRRHDPGIFRILRRALQFRVGARMQFDDGGTQRNRGVELLRIRLDEQRHADSGVG